MWSRSGQSDEVGPSWRRAGPGVIALAGLALIQSAIWWRGLPESGDGTAAYAWRAVILFALQATAAWIAWPRRDRLAVGLVLTAAVGFRLAALGWSPQLSSDLYRYLWDGRVQVAGHSPYDHPPGDPTLAPLRDDAIWPEINRPEAVTVYPPGAQVLFVAQATAGATSTAHIRTAALFAELGALVLVVLLCFRRRLSVGHLILYAWSPMVIAEVCVSGHVDAWILPAMLGALWLAERRPLAGGALIGVGALLKLYPLLLLAAVPRPARWRVCAAAVLVILAGYLPYVVMSGTDALGFLPDYVRSGEDFNPALRGFVESALAWVGPSARPVSMLIAVAALALACGWIAVSPAVDPFVRARRIGLAFILLLPTAVHPWYALFLVPLLALDFSPAALWVVGMLPLSYLKYQAEAMPVWVPLVEWLPAMALLGYSAFRFRWAVDRR